MPRPLIVAILETMYGWRGETAERGVTAPRYFKINPANHSGRRLYKLVAGRADLLVTNACRELGRCATDHGTPNPAWLGENLTEIQRLRPIDLVLVCGKVAQKTYQQCGFVASHMLELPHPAARNYWSMATIQAAIDTIGTLLPTVKDI